MDTPPTPENPINLDAERSPDDRIAAEFRRASHMAFGIGDPGHPARDIRLHAALLAGPADTWADAASGLRFLLGRFAQSREGQDRRMRQLIRRAQKDIARLLRRDGRDTE